MVKSLLLVDVEFDRAINNKSNGQYQSGWAHHPIGLMYLAAAVRDRFPDIAIRIAHTVTFENANQAILSLIDETKPDIVGLRSLSLFQNQFKSLAQAIRGHAPQLTLIGGGPYPSASYRDILSEGIVDLAVLGEGDVTLVELISRMRDTNELPSDVAGTALNVNGSLKINPDRPLIADVDSIPFPAYDLIDFKDYQGLSNLAFQETEKYALIFASRGCPYRCFYCHTNFGKKVRRRSPENVIQEMEIHYHERGVRDFMFIDDVFNVPKTVAKEILRLIVERLPGVRVNFSNGLRADQLDDEMIDLLEAVGTVHLALALETPTPRLQKLAGKNLKVDVAKHYIHKASQRFIVCTFFMVGFPSETFDEALSTVHFAKDLTYISQPVLSVVRVYRGTPLFDALSPTEEEAQCIESQTAGALTPSLFGDVAFYGDVVSKDKVPLTGEQIQMIRWEWMREVFHGKDRVRNSYTVLRKHLNTGQIINFYRNLYDRPDFDEAGLRQLLASVGLSAEAADLAESDIAE
ncbi:MAG: B12-binding domain-containing radical SAM protein [Alphaproteobacteria bacterium]|nr:B12-binding domain-containing radical SAM protein [Alphaproteobacteria bacterium]MBF0353765.1 B12-binding domain-containing radical SAM protein [Alphaproteobacteria bacterium]